MPGVTGARVYDGPSLSNDDSTVGGNPAPATPGWDYATGRGTPDISAFVASP